MGRAEASQHGQGQDTWASVLGFGSNGATAGVQTVTSGVALSSASVALGVAVLQSWY